MRALGDDEREPPGTAQEALRAARAIHTGGGDGQRQARASALRREDHTLATAHTGGSAPTARALAPDRGHGHGMARAVVEQETHGDEGGRSVGGGA